MTLSDAMARLESMGSDKVRAMHVKAGATQPLFGAKMGDVRILAKEIKTDPALAKELWETGNLDAQLLAILVMRPKALSEEEVDAMVREATFPWLADWVNSYVVKLHPQKEDLRQRWMEDEDPMAARAGWSLTAARVEKAPEGLEISGLLDRIESEMKDAPAAAQWTMNFTLAAIGINHPEHRERAMAIGEKLGVYRDYPTSKGCTSPFAPVWIAEMVQRQNTTV